MEFMTIDNKPGKLLGWEEGTVLHLQLAKEQKITPHRTAHSTLVIAQKGRVLFTVEGETKELFPGTLLLMEPNEEHALEALEESSLLVIKMGTGTPNHCMHGGD